MMTTMTSNKPYLVRALYDWIVDNQLTPYLLVDARMPGVQVPVEHVVDGQIVLNVSPQACRGLHLDNDRILFTARFSGQATQIALPPAAVLAIYAKENNMGMQFPEPEDVPPSPPGGGTDPGGRGKPALKLVK